MTAKKVLLFTSSPRKKSNSSILAREIGNGAKVNGARIKTVNLHQLMIKPCTACDKCHISDDRFCVLKDDMKNIYPQIVDAAAIIYASPVYWFTVSSQLKRFMDRCYALGGPSGYALKGKKTAAALSYGDADPFVSGAVNALRTLQDTFAYVDARFIGSVYCSAVCPGEVLKNKKLLRQAFALGKRLVEGL